ncbi:DNA-invertase hin [Halioglobus japonicus]|nr:DNA-invertase hin [Halioglobus japonicus]
MARQKRSFLSKVIWEQIGVQMPKKLGYIRTSTDTQITDRQVIKLEEICERVFIEDGVSATSKKRPVYQEVMVSLERGDTFVVSSLDRAFRSSLDALSELEKLHQRNIQFKSLSQNFDTTTPDGKFLYTLAAALATWEREILSQRTKEGLEAARRRGTRLGRPRKLSDDQVAEARRVLEADFYSSITEVAESFRVHERTLIRALEQ